MGFIRYGACREHLVRALHPAVADHPQPRLDGAHVGHVCRLAGSVEVERGEFRPALGLLDDSLTAYRRLGSRRGEALTLRAIGLVHRARGAWRISSDRRRSTGGTANRSSASVSTATAGCRKPTHVGPGPPGRHLAALAPRELGWGPPQEASPGPRVPKRAFSITPALRFQAMAFGVVDDPPPFRDLVVIGLDNADTAFGDQPLHQLHRLHASRASDGPFAVRHRSASSACSAAPPVAYRRRRGLSGHRLVTAVYKRRVVGTMTMPKVEAAGLSDLRTRPPATPPDSQESTVVQGIRRPPVTRLPGCRVFTGCEPFEKYTLPFVQGGTTDARTPAHTAPVPCIEPKE
uniref:NorR protein n=1 Tax=Streptomyces orinoci TaxID=67339 RepID=A0A0C5CHF8_STRON|nr:NorR [Streptomyces orinoci]